MTGVQTCALPILRHAAEDLAERALTSALTDEIYGKIDKDLKELSIQSAFAEIRNDGSAETLSKRIKELEEAGDRRLTELGINKDDFNPHYSCKLCNDTGYDEHGNPCTCMKKFFSSL